MKIDKYIKDLSKKFDSFSSSKINDYDEDNNNYGLNNHDDECYLDCKVTVLILVKEYLRNYGLDYWKYMTIFAA